jgi:hypothetical protein
MLIINDPLSGSTLPSFDEQNYLALRQNEKNKVGCNAA